MAAASSSSSSSRSSPASYATIDSTYTSLYSLLCAPASSSKHLCLLPPNALYSSITLYLSRLREATLPDFVKVVATSRSLWESSCIVKAGEGRIHEDVTQLPSSEPNGGQASAEPSLASRSYQIQLAAARACFSHIELLLAMGKGSTGWGTQRKLRHWVNQINSSLNEAAAPLTPHMHDIDIPRLSILTGLVIGLSAYRQQSRDAGTKPEQRLSVRLALHAAERYWLEAFGQAMQSLMDMQASPASAQQPAASIEDDWEREFKKSNVELEAVEAARRADHAREASLIPLLLAGQVAPLLSDSGLASLSPEAMLRLIPLSVLPLFSRPLLHLSSKSEELRNPTTHALFPCLGPLSRLLASAAETAVLKMRGNDVQALLLGSAEANSAGALRQIVDLATQLERDFASSNYLSATGGGAEADAQLTDTWKSLKSLLFVAVQLFDAVLDALVTTLPSPVTTIHEPAVWVAQWQQHRSQDATAAASLPAITTNIPAHVLEILKLQVIGLMRLSFVTFSMTSGGEGGSGSNEASQRSVTSNDIYNRFTTYRHAFYGSLEVIRLDWAAATTLYEELLQASEGAAASASSSPPPPAWVTRSRLVVLLDSAEQLLVSLPGSVLSDSLLPLCRPHLLPSSSSSGVGADVATFESSHACLLALFEAKRPQRLVKDVMPFYVEALLKGHERGLISGAGEAEDGEEGGGGSVGSQGQLSHALSTVVACMSDVDDARCYWVVKRLEEEVRAREGPPAGEQERRRRLDVQLALVDLLPVVNLVLLRSVLGTVRGYILAERPAQVGGEAMAEDDGSSKVVDVKGKGRASDEHDTVAETGPAAATPSSPAHALLCSRTFNALNSMDDTARQEGVRWWLDHRREFGV